MVSIESVRKSLSVVAASLLVLVQEGDNGTGFDNVEKADRLFDAHELVLKAKAAVEDAATL